ncbi:MAG: GNAT family N-acetyltransferase, partial [Planctomycetota bacterium]|nr:GNAT family N-acetyltransferase [Planctomycetota bacterium]
MLRLRPQKVSDAERFYEILASPRFTYFPVVMKSVKQERDWLRKTIRARKKGSNCNFSIVLGGRVVGAIGFCTIERHGHVAEVGYFLDEAYWGRGIVTKAVRMLEAYLRK